MPLNIAVLDLEWNAAYSRKRKGYINEIIEFGAVKCGEDFCPAKTFSCFVRPQVGKHLNSVVAGLTSITEENLTGGITFMRAVSQFRRWLGDCLLITWGLADILTLIENCRYFNGDIQVPFLTHYCDLQRYAEERLGLSTTEQAGLEKVARLLDLDISAMEQHRALDDSLVTLRILEKLYDSEAIIPYIQTCDQEFYQRMTFRTSFVRDLADPRIRPEYLSFLCPRCGGRCCRSTRWTARNRGFQSQFHCKSCGLDFVGRVMIKQKYEGINVNKKTYPVPVIESPRTLPPDSPKKLPIGNMELELQDGVGVLRFTPWKDLPFVNHAFSTRLGGISQKEFAAMNLGFGRGDSEENVSENYRRFCAAAGLDPESLVCGTQVHKTDIRRVDQSHRGLGIWTRNDTESADGLCTNAPGVSLVVFAADCVPVYFVDPVHRAIGLAHAGWRGTAAGMPAVMVRRMVEEFGSRPEELLTAIGPSICKNCFEVDEPVAKEFLALPEAESFVTGPEHEKYHVDLWECCRQSLLGASVLPENIILGGVCTMEESDLIFSHRKTRGQRGSNCAILALRP
ncbi:peptidoglycan editing factor PgeF [Acutalibacter sp. 1XD8-33]|uniref:peptidoglycan editing factor PgeF n=1 Tax=Acutalibacter sp. 1XD8-33 TaxID=2320081 RepID=UPI000EA287D9|nr:peptidoglycan editing factor PgeF [Acutalibacter sp. 1XD8-33]RKJ40521.1 peptidoglycan editing factor PgeF [Acutalibacter sp. 1XD8-33]